MFSLNPNNKGISLDSISKKITPSSLKPQRPKPQPIFLPKSEGTNAETTNLTVFLKYPRPYGSRGGGQWTKIIQGVPLNRTLLMSTSQLGWRRH